MRHVIFLTALTILGASEISAKSPDVSASKEAGMTPAKLVLAVASRAGSPALAGRLRLEGTGLRLLPFAGATARDFAFGTDWNRAKQALASRGLARSGSMEECGAGPIDYIKWEDSLTLYGLKGKFVGWFVDSSAAAVLTTAAAAPLRSTRNALAAHGKLGVFESSLGTEFVAHGLSGLLDGTGPAAKVTHWWAGEACNLE